MRYLKYTLIISLLLYCIPTKVLGCWSGWYHPKGYFMYRVYDGTISENGPNDITSFNINRNCKDWQRITSTSIPQNDIYDIVYRMPLDEYELFYSSNEYSGSNKFAQWIKSRDNEICDFLLLAKINESIREKRNSRWYYPTMKTPGSMTLEEVAERALAKKEGRLHTRYLLQAVRALFTLGRYAECISIWEESLLHLPKNDLMRQFIHPYIAGAESRLNHHEKAIAYFAEVGDIESMFFCAKKNGSELTTVEAIEIVSKKCPNSLSLPKALQSFIRKAEPYAEYNNEEDQTNIGDEHRQLLDLSLKIAKDNRVSNMAMWLYTAAFIADLQGQSVRSSKILAEAERASGTHFIKESIKVMRIYLDAKLSNYDSSYEQCLFDQLKWLDNKIVNNITEEVRAETSELNSIRIGVSYYYWNDMMRRIILSEVTPRMIKAGDYTRALQLTNMADNRLINIVNCFKDYDYNSSQDLLMTIKEYRYDKELDNSYDYSNHFFELADSIGINRIMAYWHRVTQPQSEFDKFLNARGYVGSDYLNDIIGTQCLRQMRYKEAVHYLGSVDPSFVYHLNTTMQFDPFSVEPQKSSIGINFKYEFAREMYSLEQAIKSTRNKNLKGQLMIKYAVGLRNSFSRCWGLTQYYKGDSFWGAVCDKRDWSREQATLRANKRANEIMASAFITFTDKELAAEAKHPRGACDNYGDYHAEKPKL